MANTERQSIKARCRACDEEISAEDVAVAALEAEFEYENYVAAKDGGDPSLCDCPECGLKTYIVAEDENGCAWCEYILDDECGRCSTALTPENVSADNSGLCSYCDYVMSKDD